MFARMEAVQFKMERDTGISSDSDCPLVTGTLCSMEAQEQPGGTLLASENYTIMEILDSDEGRRSLLGQAHFDDVRQECKKNLGRGEIRSVYFFTYRNNLKRAA